MPDPNHAASPFQLLLTPERAALAADGANTLRVLVRVQAPARPADPTAQAAGRDPLHLALVLDRSGSMAGAPCTKRSIARATSSTSSVPPTARRSSRSTARSSCWRR